MKLAIGSLFIASALAQTPYDTAIKPSTVALEIPVNKGSAALWQTWAPARAWMDEVVAALRLALHAEVTR